MWLCPDNIHLDVALPHQGSQTTLTVSCERRPANLPSLVPASLLAASERHPFPPSVLLILTAKPRTCLLRAQWGEALGAAQVVTQLDLLHPPPRALTWGCPGQDWDLPVVPFDLVSQEMERDWERGSVEQLHSGQLPGLHPHPTLNS